MCQTVESKNMDSDKQVIEDKQDIEIHIFIQKHIHSETFRPCTTVDTIDTNRVHNTIPMVGMTMNMRITSTKACSCYGCKSDMFRKF